MTAAPEHNYSCELTSVLHARPGDDVTLHFGAVIRSSQSVDDLKVLMTALVDYESVEAKFVRKSLDRTRTINSWHTDGLTFDASERILQLDVSFPADLFEQKRMYELGVALIIFNSDGQVQEDTFRYNLYYGSYDKPPRPCFEPATVSDDFSKEVESALTEVPVGAMLARRTSSGGYNVPDRVVASPGERLEFTYFHQQSFRPGPMMAVPMLEGETLTDGWQFVQPEPHQSSSPSDVDPLVFRDDLRFEAPSDPGTYYLTVPLFRGPYLVTRDLEGCDFDVPSPDFGGSFNAWPVEIVVKDD